MTLAGLAVLLAAAAGQTVGPESLVGWSAGAAWWDCGDLGSSLAAALGYQWPGWLAQITYAEPDTTRHGVSVRSEIWAIEAFRLWRGPMAYRRPAWLAGLGVCYLDVGTRASGSARATRDTASHWAAAAIIGFSWPSGWQVQLQCTAGASAELNLPGGRADLDLDGLRVVVSKRF